MALSVGPLNEDMATMITHMYGVGQLHKIKLGANPISNMSRVQLMTRGVKREKVPAARKLPFPVDDLRTLKILLDQHSIDRQIAWCDTLMVLFFILIMCEVLVTTNQNISDGRHPRHMLEIEPRSQGVRDRRGTHADCASIRISGSKTDWVNQGRIRSHTSMPACSANSDLYLARALVMLQNMCPVEFAIGIDKTLATWMRGSPIPGTSLTSLLRYAVFKRGLNPGAPPLRSLRGGGATALCHSTRGGGAGIGCYGRALAYQVRICVPVGRP